MKVKIFRMFLLPNLICSILSYMFGYEILAILFFILTLDNWIALFPSTKHFGLLYYVNDIWFLASEKHKYYLPIPLLGWLLVHSIYEFDERKAYIRLQQARECGFVFWYVLYATEYLLHFFALLVLFRTWYYEEYRGDDMGTIKRKFLTLHYYAKKNVCFNEAYEDRTKNSTREPYAWLNYLLNKTQV